ncbi:MAG: hypothetical protein ABI388_02565 [Bacteroidia bacterium]
MLNKLFSALLIASALLFSSSCQKTAHYIRFANNYWSGVYSVVAGTAQIGDVPALSASNYQLISDGNFSVSGHTSNGNAITGSGYTSGSGTHYWTITLSASGQLSIATDR